MSSSAVDMYLRRFSRAGGRPASIFSAVINSSKRKYWTEKPCSTARIQHRFRRADPSTGGQRVDARALDGRLESEVEVLQRLAGRQVGQLQRGLHPPRLAAGQLRLEQDVEEGMRCDLLAHGVTQHLVEMIGGMGTTQSHKPLAGGINVELRLGRVHRATSAKAA